MSGLLTRLAEMIEEIIIEAEDEPHFTTREHATTGAEEMHRELIRPVLAEAWDEGHESAALRIPEGVWHDVAAQHPGNPYRKEQDR